VGPCICVSVRWEGERLELMQAVEAEKLASREALKPLDQLRLDHSILVEVRALRSL
jgi:hypothetical protein